MKTTTALLLFILTTGGVLCFGGCSHRQPKSSYRIIESGDRNPYIINNPARAGTVVRRKGDPR